MGYHYDSDYRETVTLLDGSRALIRCVRPEDKALIAEGLGRLSEEGRYRRFFSPKPRLSDRELAFLTEIDGVDHFAIGAMRQGPDGNQGLGIARFMRRADEPRVAEPAIAVVDEAQGLGLGTELFARLMAAARERGILHFRAEILATNDSIKQLMRNLQPGVRFVANGREEVVEMPIPDFEPAHISEQTELLVGPIADLIRAVSTGAALVRNTFTGFRDMLRRPGERPRKSGS